MEEKWLVWAREIESIARAGLTYSKDRYDIERFENLLNISAEIVSNYSDIEKSKMVEILIEKEGYLTPKVDVRAAIIKDEKILLVKERLDGKWSLPGGWADVNLSVSENIIKESKEEAGANVKPKRIIAILDRNRHNKPISLNSIYKIFVLCEYVDGNFIENTETEEIQFFKLDKLPELSNGRNNYEQIKMCFNAYYNQKMEVIFD